MMYRRTYLFRVLGTSLAIGCVLSRSHGEEASLSNPDLSPREFTQEFCFDCHSGEDAAASLDLDLLSSADLNPETLARNSQAWEKVVRRLSSRQMPPSDASRPDEAAYDAATEWLARSLDSVAERNPRPGRTETFRRLTRTEYQNAIRDLLAIQVDAKTLLPKDESTQGFDNITVGELSPALLNRYVTAAQKISRLAVGGDSRVPIGDAIRIPPDVTQEDHLLGLPIGTRGGTLIPYTFPQTGEYEIQVRLARDRNEEVEGLNEMHELELLLDRERLAQFTVMPPPRGSNDFSKVDAHLTKRIPVSAGPHLVGITFIKKSASLLETDRQPYRSRFNMHRHPRTAPAVYQVSITGPYDASGPGDTPSRRRVFTRNPDGKEDEEDCANEILGSLARRAWRRPVQKDDLHGLMKFFRQGRNEGDFDLGIETALASLLVSPEFLFRIERDPPDAPTGTAYRIRDVELASRLSFFLWSSIPDEELLTIAEAGRLSEPAVLEQQVLRMLADPRSRSLVTNFAGQWLYLRNLESAHPDMRLFPDFDDNLRQAMRKETELLFESVVREDRSVMELLSADYTFLNERLARHYGIPHVHGSRFRRVELDNDSKRGGLLRQASILTVTSYATRTSPVIRGHWILKNVLGSPPPPPPPNVPALKDNTVLASLSVRDRLAQHRADPNCAGCHNLMDPVGFSLENYDAIGRWRDLEVGQPIDASGSLPDGTEFNGAQGLESGLLKRPGLFVGTLTEKLMTFALGRGLDHDDAPAIRRILRDAKENDYRFSSLVVGIAESTPFQMRTAE